MDIILDASKLPPLMKEMIIAKMDGSITEAKNFFNNNFRRIDEDVYEEKYISKEKQLLDEMDFTDKEEIWKLYALTQYCFQKQKEWSLDLVEVGNYKLVKKDFDNDGLNIAGYMKNYYLNAYIQFSYIFQNISASVEVENFIEWKGKKVDLQIVFLALQKLNLINSFDNRGFTRWKLLSDHFVIRSQSTNDVKPLLSESFASYYKNNEATVEKKVNAVSEAIKKYLHIKE